MFGNSPTAPRPHSDAPPRGWLLEFLESHGALHKLRTRIAVGSLGLALVLAAAVGSPAGLRPPFGAFLAAAILVLGLLRALWWLLGPWPSTRQSAWSMGVADLTIAGVGWLTTDHLVGLAVTPGFLLPGAFLTFFHGPRVVAAHIAWVTLTVVSLAVAAGSSAAHGGPIAAAALGLLNLIVAVGILPMLRVGFGVVRQGADESLIDPLTGLANRRGLDHRLDRFRSHSNQKSMCVFTIDLDRFKAVNDRYGHAVGDEVLIQTADVITATMGPGALIARIGGEEFVAVDLLESSSVQPLADRLRSAIAETTHPAVTASIGVALTTAHDLPDSRQVAIALECADMAMYSMKHDGGNAARVHSCTDYAKRVTSSTAAGQSARPAISAARNAGSPSATASSRPSASPDR